MAVRRKQRAPRKAPLEPVIFGVPVPYSERMSLDKGLVPLGDSLVIQSESGFITITLGNQQIFCSMRRPSAERLGLAHQCQMAENHLKALRTTLNKLGKK